MALGYCVGHYYQLVRGGSLRPKFLAHYCDGTSEECFTDHRGMDQGYVVLYHKWDHSSSGRLREHVYVMSRMLGRPLVNGETVHHKNGVRHDNRPDNLELWVSHQPSGQRPEDLLAWADEIYARYGSLKTPWPLARP